MPEQENAEAMTEAQTQTFNLAANDSLVKLYEEDLNIDLTPVDNIDVEIVISKSFGSTERMEAKTKVGIKDARAAVIALYKNAFTPRALSHAKETVDYQLEADRLSREVQKRDLEEQREALKNQRSKK